MDKSTLELLIRTLTAERNRLTEAIETVKSGVMDGPVRPEAKPTTRITEVPTSTSVAKPRRKMSAAARHKISEAMKRRYAAMRSAATPKLGQQRLAGGLTVAGRKKLSDMMKARWAAKRRAGKK